MDEICYRHYGTSHGTVEAVLEANRGLAVPSGDPLPSGLIISLPVVPASKALKAERLWTK